MVVVKSYIEDVKFTKIDDRFVYDAVFKCPACGNVINVPVIKLNEEDWFECPRCGARFTVKVALVLISKRMRV